MNFAVPVSHVSNLPKQNPPTSLELADIFNLHADDYRATHKLSPKQHKAIFNIKHCRTGVNGNVKLYQKRQ